MKKIRQASYKNFQFLLTVNSLLKFLRNLFPALESYKEDRRGRQVGKVRSLSQSCLKNKPKSR